MDHHLVALSRGAGVDPVVQRRLCQQRQRVRLLLLHRRRFLGHVRRAGGRIRGAPLLIQRLSRGGQRLHEQGADLRCQPPFDPHRAVAVRIHVQRPARVLQGRLPGLGLPVHSPPAPHNPLDMLGGARAAHRQQPRFGLWRRYAR